LYFVGLSEGFTIWCSKQEVTNLVEADPGSGERGDAAWSISKILPIKKFHDKFKASNLSVGVILVSPSARQLTERQDRFNAKIVKMLFEQHCPGLQSTRRGC
jgi:hypothetical protein